MEAKEPAAKRPHRIEKWERKKKKKIRDETGHEQWDKTTSAQGEKQNETGSEKITRTKQQME